MRIIYKVHVTESPVYLPASAQILDIGMQDYKVILWYSFENHEEHTVEHLFRAIPTGGFVPGEDFIYMKTIIDGVYVWHIYKK